MEIIYALFCNLGWYTAFMLSSSAQLTKYVWEQEMIRTESEDKNEKYILLQQIFFVSF